MIPLAAADLLHGASQVKDATGARHTAAEL